MEKEQHVFLASVCKVFPKPSRKLRQSIAQQKTRQQSRTEVLELYVHLRTLYYNPVALQPHQNYTTHMAMMYTSWLIPVTDLAFPEQKDLRQCVADLYKRPPIVCTSRNEYHRLVQIHKRKNIKHAETQMLGYLKLLEEVVPPHLYARCQKRHEKYSTQIVY